MIGILHVLEHHAIQPITITDADLARWTQAVCAGETDLPLGSWVPANRSG